MEAGNESSQVMASLSFIKKKKRLLFWVTVAAQAFSVIAVSRGASLVAVCRLLIAVASLVAEQGL